MKTNYSANYCAMRHAIRGMVLVLVVTLLGAATALAQQSGSSANSRVDLFGGYSLWAPSGKINGYSYRTVTPGAEFSFAYYFHKNLGAEVEYDYHPTNGTNGGFSVTGGPIYRLPRGNYNLFAHALVGVNRVSGPNQPSINGSSFFFEKCTPGPQFTLGGGVDYTPHAHHGMLGFRIFQVDYQLSHIDYGPLKQTTGGIVTLNSFRISTGIVLHFNFKK